MVKLTKAQRKDQDRISAWVSGLPFREGAKEKPAVPELTTEDVLEQFVPEYISDFGAFYTPLEMAWAVFNNIPLVKPFSIIDPCAGIGNLIYPSIETEVYLNGGRVVANELDKRAYAVGKRIFPDAEWHNENAYDLARNPKFISEFDAVIMNPPFNINWATVEGSISGYAKKSEHLFLEVAIQLLRPWGIAMIIAPFNYFDSLPKKFSPWVEDRIESFSDMGELTGKFRFTGVRVHGWYMIRNAQYHIEKENKDMRIDNNDESDPPREKPSLPPPMAKPAPAVVEVAPIGGGGLTQTVSAEWFDALSNLDVDYANRQEVATALAYHGEKDAAAWVKNNPILWGYAYYNGITDQSRLFVPCERE